MARHHQQRRRIGHAVWGQICRRPVFLQLLKGGWDETTAAGAAFDVLTTYHRAQVSLPVPQ